MQKRLEINSEQHDFVLKIQNGEISFLNHARMMGWESVGFAIIVEGKKEKFPETYKATRKIAKSGLAEIQLIASYPISRVTEKMLIRYDPHKRFICVKREFFNNTPQAIAVDAVLDGQGKIVFPNRGPYDVVRFGHVDNVRLEKAPLSRGEYPYIRNIPSHLTLLGDSEAQTMPFLFLCNSSLDAFLYEASCQENVFRRFWELEGVSCLEYKNNGSIFKHYNGIQKDIHERSYVISPGASFVGSHMFYQIKKDGGINTIHDDYVDYIAERNCFRGLGTILKSSSIYCTWNYGVCQNISEKFLLKQAAYISKNIPGIKFFQIDLGYQSQEGDLLYDIGKFYTDPENIYDRVKFPHGMKYMADAIKKLGLRPAIWWTPTICIRSELAQKNHDWLAKDQQGAVWTVDGKSGMLDFSVPGVRQFIENILDVLFTKWGYEGIKLDFWTNAFENGGIRLKGHSVEARRWLLKSIRERLPADGFLEICSAASMGNPFLAEYADAYRVGVDVAGGEWHEHVLASNWALPLLSVESRKTFLLNMDSLGVRPDLSDEENLSRLTWCFITQGVLEVAGDLTTLSKKQIEWMRTVTDNCDRGYKCSCPDEDVYFKYPLPEILYVRYPNNSQTRKNGVLSHVAIFNWKDAEKIVALPFSSCCLNGKEKLVDFWSGKTIKYHDNHILHKLKPRESILIEVKQ